MARKLKNLFYSVVALVDRGASRGAKVALYKREPPAPDPTKEPTMADTTNADAIAKLAKLEADQAALLKRLDDAEAARAKAEKDASDKSTALAAEIAKAAERNDREECIRKAVALPQLGKADDLGGLLYDVRKAVAPEAFGKLETLLKSVNQQLRVNKLFVAVGADGGNEGTTPEDKLNAMAKAHADKHNMSVSKAYIEVCKTDEGKALYAASLEG